MYRKMLILMAVVAAMAVARPAMADSMTWPFDSGDSPWALIDNANWTTSVSGGNMVVAADLDPDGSFALSQAVFNPSPDPTDQIVRFSALLAAADGDFVVDLQHDPRPNDTTTDTSLDSQTITPADGFVLLELDVPVGNLSPEGQNNFWKLNYSEGNTDPGASLLVDTITIETLIPEPASLALLGLGGLALLRRRR